MIIKKKSLVVALVSGTIISLVLVLTLVGYVMYIEIKQGESGMAYRYLLQKTNAKTYSKHLEVSKLAAKMENAGPLKGKPIIEGVIANKGLKGVSYILMKIKFLDRDGTIIYEVIFEPQEPSLGSSSLSQLKIPYLFNAETVELKPGGALAFKKILTNCPDEISSALREGSGFARGALGVWSGKFECEFLSVDF